MSDFDSQLDQFLDRLRSGEAGAKDAAEMEAMLSADAELRRRYRSRVRLESHLLSAMQVVQKDLVPPLEISSVKSSRGNGWRLPLVASVGLAAGLAVALFVWIQGQGPRTVATLESTSNAAWSGPVNITGGSKLAPGEVRLVSGIVEIRFDSGALVTLEAPVHFEIETAMRGRLISGMASVEAPESAHGFVIETPHGFIEDLGTRFSVSVGERQAEIEVHEGEVAVYPKGSKEVLRLREDEASALTASTVHALKQLPSSLIDSPSGQFVAIDSAGRETSVILSEEIVRTGEPSSIAAWSNPGFLMVKLGAEEEDIEWTRRVLISFPLSSYPRSRVASVRLRLNLVPCGSGFAAGLPDRVRFKVYGITDERRESWPTQGLQWKDAPGCIEGLDEEVDLGAVRLVGEFEIPRGQQTGSIVIEDDALTKFVMEDTTGTAGFMILRETRGEKRKNLVHSFASSRHPEAAGPTLEIIAVD